MNLEKKVDSSTIPNRQETRVFRDSAYKMSFVSKRVHQFDAKSEMKQSDVGRAKKAQNRHRGSFLPPGGGRRALGLVK